ncbi:magnesium chelatase, partial [Klebsiella oxytoca]
MASQFLAGNSPDKVEAVCQAEEIVKLQEQVKGVLVQEAVLGYMEDIVLGTREEAGFALGA